MISQPFPVSLVPPFLHVVIKSSEVLRTKKAALPVWDYLSLSAISPAFCCSPAQKLHLDSIFFF